MDVVADHRLGRQDRPGHRLPGRGDLASRPHSEQATARPWASSTWAAGTEPGRVDAACARALHLRSYSYRSVESILKHSLDGQPLPGTHPARLAHPGYSNVRGARYYN